MHSFSHLQDEKLMELYQNGENMAFEVIYLRHKNRIYSYLNKRISDKILVEDIFQNIFIKFHKSRHLYQSKYPLLSWLYTISKSELLDMLKKKKINFVEFNESYIKQSHHDEIEILPQNVSQDLGISAVRNNFLSENEKLAISLRYYSEEDFSEIATILKTSEANSRKIVSRGIKKLRLKWLGELE